MVRHTVYSRFNVVARNHAGFNSLLKAAEEAGIIEVIRPETPKKAPQIRAKSSHPPPNVQPPPLWRRKRASSAPPEGETESPVAKLRSRPARRSVDDVPEVKATGEVKDATRVIGRSKNSMVLRRRRRRRMLTSKKSTRQAKANRIFMSKAPERADRENVPEDNFDLNGLAWTPWQAAIAPSSESKASSSAWAPRREGPGYRRITLFKHKTDCPAVYEFAVQPPGSNTKYPVQYKTTKGFSKGSWDAKLMSDWPTERQIDRIVRRGCKVYARRAQVSQPVKCGDTLVKSLDELKSLVGQTYDYAWRQHYQVDTRRYVHRNVEVDGVKISDNPNWNRL